MPGIVGVIARQPSTGIETEVDAMLSSMMHKSFYRNGKVVQQAHNLACGWVSHQGSFSDCMPVWNERRDICLIFSGEEFTESSDIEGLKPRHEGFNTKDASYLVHLYEEAGAEFFAKLNGWFSGLLIDLGESKVYIFNDRFGIGRIYFHENERGLYFASEAKALLKIVPSLRDLDPRGLGEFFSVGCVLQNRTFFRGISLLPPASLWVVETPEKISKRKYFEPTTWEQQPQLNSAAYYEAVKATWARLIPRYLRGSERVALSLTGGVDSRMILAWANGTPSSLPCYTFGGRYRDCADVTISRQIAGICHRPHEVIPISGQFFSDFPDLARNTVYLSDGTMDVTGSIDLYVQRAARKIAPVRVTGTNGGEILRSLVAFKPMPLSRDLFQSDFRQWFDAAAGTYSSELSGHRLSFTAFKQAPWYMNSKFVVERSEVTLRMPYFDNDLVSLVYQAPAEASASNDLSLRLIEAGNPNLANIGTDRGVKLSPIPGVTAARRFWQEFTFKAEYAYDYGMPQWLAKTDHALARLHFDRLFLGRHKFHHFRLFYRDELAGFVKEILLDPSALSRPYLERKTVENMVNGHTKGDQNHTLELHKLLTTELIHRTLLN
jgi:asparagine synthase (glutamine-hydrolysing)